jgi:DDE superfamily endonuclease
MAKKIFVAEMALWINNLSGLLHRGNAWRLAPLLWGMLFGRGRRTVACWLRVAELGDDYQGYYYFLGSLGRNVKAVAGALLRLAVNAICPGERLLFAIDDTPTKRYGKHVEGAGIHHNPTPGPAEQKYLYGHVWVTLAWVVRHARWGTIGLPLLAFLYVRRANLASIAPWCKVKFQTKLEQAAALVEWAACYVNLLGKKLWIVVDGAYIKKPFLERAKKAGVTVVGRLRKDAALWSVPVPVPAGQRKRGAPRKYGKDRISLAKRAGHRQGWTRETFKLYGEEKLVCYKTFLATYKPAGGLLRVVIVRELDGSWRAYCCTDVNATVAEILEAVADRSAIEQNFHDLKEVHGVGQQQLRNYWANIAAYHLTLWLHTLIEVWAWHKPKEELVDRSASPWDDASRRPSHADRRNALRRRCLEAEFLREAESDSLSRKIRRAFNRLMMLAV